MPQTDATVCGLRRESRAARYSYSHVSAVRGNAATTHRTASPYPLLPPYIFFFSAHFHHSQTINVQAPLSVTPSAVLAGSCIPTLDPSIFTLGNATNTSVPSLYNGGDVLHLWTFPDAHVRLALQANAGKVYFFGVVQPFSSYLTRLVCLRPERGVLPGA